jgi:hypothetical protein
VATETEVTQRIDVRLDALQANLDDLCAVAQEWQVLPEGERVAWSLDWDHLMSDYLRELDHAFRARRMTATQQQRYRAVLRKLAEALPIIEQLDLHRPPVRLKA